MIRNTFSILNGVGERLERRLWGEGILTWPDFIGAESIELIKPEKKSFFDYALSSAARQLDNGNAVYFARALRRREHWRLFEVFRGNAVCLDIETSGLQPEKGGYVTVVGLYDGLEWKHLMCGENLSAKNLEQELSGYKCLITYYGSSFDIPFLQKTFPGVRFDIPHFDLCFAARKLGFKGGLKKLEVMLGIERDESVIGMDGYEAVKLWDAARKGSREARELLLTYNREDTVNLLQIAGKLYNGLKQETGIEEYIVCGAA